MAKIASFEIKPTKSDHAAVPRIIVCTYVADLWFSGFNQPVCVSVYVCVRTREKKLNCTKCLTFSQVA